MVKLRIIFCLLITMVLLMMLYAALVIEIVKKILDKPTKPCSDERKDLDIKFNLKGETSGMSKFQEAFTSYQCTIEYINKMKLQQDHPCVIEILQRDYLIPPPPDNVQLNLNSSYPENPSPGQTDVILRLLKNQTKGFFVDCGAHDGEFISNTIFLERRYEWSGILIEAHPVLFEKLRKKNRKSWAAPVCLSLQPYPTRVKFQPKIKESLSHIEGSVKTLQKPGIAGKDPNMVEVQCFPLYSILLAVGITRVDYFSLDVEGHELAILKTIPFHKVFFKSLSVEWDNIPEGEPALTSFMEKNGFLKISKFKFKWTDDVIFIRDMINDSGY